MPLNEIRIVLTPMDGVTLTQERIDEIARDACIRILSSHGRLGSSREHGGSLESVRYNERVWNTVRYPGEGREWAVTEDEMSVYDEDEEYDDD